MAGVGSRAAGIGAVVLLSLSCATTAVASTLPDRSITKAGQVARWHGKSPDQTGQGYGPPTEQSCTTTTCDSFILHVKLAPGTFPKGAKSPSSPGIARTYSQGVTDMPGDGILVAIKWATDFDQWNLYVDDMKTHQTVAQGIDLDSNAQSVLIKQPHNGDYRVTIVPFYTDFDKVDLSYRGEARVFHDPTQRIKKKHRLLPAIRTLAPSNFHIADIPPIPSNPTGWRFTGPGTFPGNSCYTDETAQFGSTRCLRFDNDTRNVGSGPLVLRFAYAPEAFAGHCKMEQEVLYSNASVTSRNAGPCIFHTQHAHFHYQNFGRYELYRVGTKGKPGARVALSRKVGFCTIDVDDYNFGKAAQLQRPRTYSFPTCNIPNGYSTQLPTTGYGPGVPEYMGISPGWGDVYTWDLPAQYIDITHGVPNGVYEVVSRTNPDGGLLTASRAQETGITCIRLTGTKVQTLNRLPSQANSTRLPNCYAKPHPKHKKKPGTKRSSTSAVTGRSCTDSDCQGQGQP
jgi:hypothetical protein